jgi:hypothetical protein
VIIGNKFLKKGVVEIESRTGDKTEVKAEKAVEKMI